MKKYVLLLSIFTLLLWQVTAQAQIITTVAGSMVNTYTGDGGQATVAGLSNPFGIAVDEFGNMYISDSKHHCIRKVNAAGIINTIAGTGVAGFSGDGGEAVDALINSPTKLVLDNSGNIYFVDNANYRIRKISNTGIITTIAGNGLQGYSGDGGMATDASINASPGIALDNSGSLLFCDVQRHVIRRVSSLGVITTIAGSGISGYMGDGGTATSARLNEPFGIDIDNEGNLYIAEYRNNCIRKVNTSGIISTLTGFITTGYSGDGGAATNAMLNRPVDVIADKYGKLYIADANNSVIRQIDNDGIISTIVGTGTSGFSGDGGHATAAQLRGPSDVALDSHGNLYIADYGNNRIRKISDVVAVNDVTLSSENKMIVYPNPNNGNFYVQVPEGGLTQGTIRVMDIAGRIVWQYASARGELVAVNLQVPPGMYIVGMTSQEWVCSTKIIVR